MRSQVSSDAIILANNHQGLDKILTMAVLDIFEDPKDSVFLPLLQFSLEKKGVEDARRYEVYSSIPIISVRDKVTWESAIRDALLNNIIEIADTFKNHAEINKVISEFLNGVSA